MLRKFIFILLTISILLSIYIWISDFGLLEIKGNNKTNYYPLLRLLIAIYFSILFLLSFRKKYNFYYFLNLLWLVPVIILLVKTLFGLNNLQKVDYLMSKKIENFSIREYKNREWAVKEIIVNTGKNIDTLYYSGNPCCDKKIFTFKEIQKSNVSKSLITGYYYISVKE